MNFKTSDGVTLEFSSVGEGTPIIFIAGYSGHEYSWSAQTDFLSQSGFRCLHLDKRGHGKNADAISGLRMSRLAKDIKEMVNLLGLKATISSATRWGVGLLLSTSVYLVSMMSKALLL